MIQVDKEKCRKDRICASVCPMGIIRLKGDDGFPEMVADGGKVCLLCGHCVAVCPHGALSHEVVPIEACPPIREELSLDLQRAVQFLRSRRSVRVFKDQPVEREKIQQLIEIARYAPTGSNSQLVQWTVFTQKEHIHALARMAVDWIRKLVEGGPKPGVPAYMPMIVAGWDAGRDTVLRNVPCLIIASTPRDNPNGMVDLTLALCYLELAATTMGLGTCWAGLLQRALVFWEPLKQAVGLPEGHTNHYPMMLGYPKFRYHRLPERKPPSITWRT
ncbi:MAG: nitroreductase family protein [Thermodesulfobacteriota bacterium]